MVQISQNSQNFDSILQALINDKNASGTTREKGKLFERLVAKLLQVLPIFKSEFKEVYLWSEFSLKFDINKQDTGVDIMALTHNDKWISVQCKALNTEHKISQGDLRQFLGINTIQSTKGESFEISQKLIFHTCKETSVNFDNALENAKINDIKPKSYGYDELKNFDIKWDEFTLDDDLSSLKLLGKKPLRDYQLEAIDAIKDSFVAKNESRARLIMACGTGKSLLSIRTIDTLVAQNELALFFAPSLALINQMLIEFFKESESKDYKVFAVCSDTNIEYTARTSISEALKDSEDIKASDIVIPVISNPQNLATQIKYYHAKAKKIIIFSTYQSIDCVIEAQKELLKDNADKFTFKLIINDEAHRTAGIQKLDTQGNKKEISIWQKTHNNDLLKAKHRLYMTATPRVYTDKETNKINASDEVAKIIQENELMLYSMDDENVFGREIYSLRFDDAITRKVKGSDKSILCDYKVLITFIDKEIGAMLANNKGKGLKTDDMCQMLGLYKAIQKKDLYLADTNGDENEQATLEIFDDLSKPMQRVVAFHSSIKKSKAFTSNFHFIDEEHISEDYTRHIDGTHNARDKARLLSWLKELDENSEFKILSNAKCLTEGVDVPNLDGVAFFDPRDSVVDIVQAVGRVMRQAEGKKYGYIILPIALSEEEIKNYNATLNSKAFKCVWKVLKALRSHDERLVDISRINEVVKVLTTKKDGDGGRGDGDGDIENPLPFPPSELAKGIKNAIPKKLGDLAYWENSVKEVGAVMLTISSRIEALLAKDAKIKDIFESFCKALRTSLNAGYEIKDAISLVAQHIITKPIFNKIYPNLDFSRFDKVSYELDRVYEEACKYGLQEETKDLKQLYLNVERVAQNAQSDKSKQDLIRNLYDSLFKSAFPKDQQQLGIVYTPIEVIDFIINSIEYALKKHFNKSLKDRDIHILDPFTGTGSFITRLIQSGLINENLPHKYKSELWANEITLLGYYIAQLNITSAYHEHLAKIQSDSNAQISVNSLPNSAQNSQIYQLFDNLLFTDTFETYDSESKGFKGDSLKLENAEYFAKNLSKINEFKNQEFKVIFGNPPYSAGQKNANDNNKNTAYPALDEQISNTYANSKYKVQKFKYDSFKRAMRYASNRIENSGIVAFVSNGSFIDGKSDKGLRACLESEFNEIYIFNLRGDINKAMQSKDKSEGENIFGNASTTPTTIFLLIKCKNSAQNSQKATIHYYDINAALNENSRKTRDKLNLIARLNSIENLENKWQIITPNKNYDWINQGDESFENLTPLCDKKFKFKALGKQDKLSIFEAFSMGIVSARDVWVYNFSKENLAQNMQKMIANYNGEVDKRAKDETYQPTMDGTKIKWTDNLKSDFSKKVKFSFENSRIVSVNYRPFSKMLCYFSKNFIERPCQMPQIYPTPQNSNFSVVDCGDDLVKIKAFYEREKYLPNLSICIFGGENDNFTVLITNFLRANDAQTQTQCFPLYYYEKLENAGSGNLFENSHQKSPSLAEGDLGGGLNSAATNYRRKDGIRDEALDEIRRKYKDEKITKEDIFYYIYALLNHKGYKEKYKNNLSKMLPHIPFVKDFWEFSKIGRDLAKLHLNYEGYANKCRALVLPKDELNTSSGLFSKDSKGFLEGLNDEDFALKEIEFLGKKGKKDKSTIIFNRKIAITQIPSKAYEFVVNGSSAIEWIMEYYREKPTDRKGKYKAAGLTNNANHYECTSGALSGLKGGKYALYLLLSVIEMSILSVEILDKLAEFGLDEVG